MPPVPFLHDLFPSNPGNSKPKRYYYKFGNPFALFPTPSRSPSEAEGGRSGRMFMEYAKNKSKNKINVARVLFSFLHLLFSESLNHPSTPSTLCPHNVS